MKIHNRPDLVFQRKYLRNHCTPAESALWQLLKGKKLDGRKFRRQHSVGEYVLDFYCPSEQLAVELDGEYHNTPEAMEHDEERRKFIEGVGILVIRFPNSDVFERPAHVLDQIMQHFKKSRQPRFH